MQNLLLKLGTKFSSRPIIWKSFFPKLNWPYIGYLTIDNKNKNDFINDKWLSEYNAKEEGQYVQWYQFNDPFNTIIDGLSGDGKILMPQSEKIAVMDEEDSTGI